MQEKRLRLKDSGVQTLPPQFIHNVKTEVRITFFKQFLFQRPQGALYVSETQT